MRTYLLRAPTWVVGVVTGGFFGLTMGAFVWYEGETAWFVAATVLFGVLVFGLPFALATRSQRRGYLNALEQVPTTEWKQVRRAAWRGPAPSDPAVRSAALDLANHIYDRAYRQRWWIYGSFGLNLVLGIVGLATGGSRWYIPAAVGWTVGIVSHWYNLRRFRRRIALLQ